MEEEEEEHYYRLICLVVDIGTEVMLKLFTNSIPPNQTLEAFLNSKMNIINGLRRKQVLNDLHYNALTVVPIDMSKFDISLLYVLITNLTNVPAPIGDWNTQALSPSDQSPGALLIRFREKRNTAIAHRPNGKLKKSEFEKHWRETEGILVGLAGAVGHAEQAAVQQNIKDAKVKQLGKNPKCEENVLAIRKLQEDNSDLAAKVDQMEQKRYEHELLEIELPGALADRVSSLPKLLQESRAVNTSISYERGFQRWRKWAVSNGLGVEDTLPAKAFHVALYLAALIQSCNTPSPIVNAFYSIKWLHDILDYSSPTDSKLVINVLNAAKRKLAKPVNKKEPMSVEILQKLYYNLYEDKNVKNQRTICICLIAFAGFLRSAEVLLLKRSDFMFFDSYMSIFIESSKTDKYREGAWVYISRTGTALCPVANLEKYFSWANIDAQSELFIFAQLTATKNVFLLRKNNKSLSYSNFRTIFLNALKPLVQDSGKFCLHSLRAGGATTAANNGIPDRLFKRHGRWLSESAKDGYVKSSIEEKLRVSKSLGL